MHDPNSVAGPVTIVSTATTDRFPQDTAGHRRCIPGGPGHYIALALRRLDVEYVLVTGERATFDILPQEDGEEYLVPVMPLIPLPDHFPGPATILSPVAREIDPACVPRAEGILAVDLQGFVRRPGRPSTDLETVDLSDLLRRTTVVKASEPELRHLSAASLDSLRSAVVLQTRGTDGVDVRVAGRTHRVPAVPVCTPHTIGAGDTYLSAFVVSLLRGRDPLQSAADAARFTETVLADRARDQTEDGPGELLSLYSENRGGRKRIEPHGTE